MELPAKAEMEMSAAPEAESLPSLKQLFAAEQETQEDVYVADMASVAEPGDVSLQHTGGWGGTYPKERSRAGPTASAATHS